MFRATCSKSCFEAACDLTVVWHPVSDTGCQTTSNNRHYVGRVSRAACSKSCFATTHYPTAVGHPVSGTRRQTTLPLTRDRAPTGSYDEVDELVRHDDLLPQVLTLDVRLDAVGR
jgi:hypothetical protein